MPISISTQLALVAVWTATLPFWAYSEEWGNYPAGGIAVIALVAIVFVPGRPSAAHLHHQ
jgi:low affinity Fe/Cu permease